MRMITIEVHCINMDGFSYEFEMQVPANETRDNIDHLIMNAVSYNKYLREYYWNY